MGLQLPEDYFEGERAGKEGSYWIMRIIHYPPLMQGRREGWEVGAALGNAGQRNEKGVGEGLRCRNRRDKMGREECKIFQGVTKGVQRGVGCFTVKEVQFCPSCWTLLYNVLMSSIHGCISKGLCLVCPFAVLKS